MKEDALALARQYKAYGRDRARSDSGQGSDDHQPPHDPHDLHDLHEPHDPEHIRRIIGVPDDPPNDTSGDSSPQRDEMDDIQKKIHSFHTENIQILKSRNKKPPKEKRKKVNLNFDLNMVDDQISIQLRTEDDSSSKSPEMNGDVHDEVTSQEDVKLHVSPENIPLPPVESIPLPAPETIPLPEEPSPVSVMPSPETIPLPEEPMKPWKTKTDIVEKEKEESPSELATSVVDSPLPFSTRFSSTGLFSGIYSMTQSFKVDTINENIPNMSVIKSAIDRTTSLKDSGFPVEGVCPVDDLKSVQEILTRVNNMDSNNSVLLSGVLSVTSVTSVTQVMGLQASASTTTASGVNPVASRPYAANDPRLNPPPQEKPKPVRRKVRQLTF